MCLTDAADIPGVYPLESFPHNEHVSHVITADSLRCVTAIKTQHTVKITILFAFVRQKDESKVYGRFYPKNFCRMTVKVKTTKNTFRRCFYFRQRKEVMLLPGSVCMSVMNGFW